VTSDEDYVLWHADDIMDAAIALGWESHDIALLISMLEEIHEAESDG
jgi:hypothetical protein